MKRFFPFHILMLVLSLLVAQGILDSITNIIWSGALRGAPLQWVRRKRSRHPDMACIRSLRGTPPVIPAAACRLRGLIGDFHESSGKPSASLRFRIGIDTGGGNAVRCPLS